MEASGEKNSVLILDSVPVFHHLYGGDEIPFSNWEWDRSWFWISWDSRYDLQVIILAHEGQDSGQQLI